MSRKILGYTVFFVVLLTGFLFFVFKDEDLSKSLLPVINPDVQAFSFTSQDGKTVTENNVDGKVYVAEYFFTTCKAICPKMNANMRRVFDMYKDEPNFLILSHTCMPEVDSVSVLKKHEYQMLAGDLVKRIDGSYEIKNQEWPLGIKPELPPSKTNSNWLFLTGDKASLYKMARQSYMIDNNKPDTLQVDKQRRVRGIYDGLNEDEMQKLLKDIKGLLKEKVTAKHFMNGFSNNPN
jgi:protein SCO1